MANLIPNDPLVHLDVRYSYLCFEFTTGSRFRVVVTEGAKY